MSFNQAGMQMDNPRMPGGISGVKFGGDDVLLVRFQKAPRLLEDASKKAGRAVYDSVVTIAIDVPADRTMSLTRRAKLDPTDPENDMARFPKQWAAFQADEDQDQVGTPLEELRFLNVELRAEYRAAKVRTAEHLAAINDSVLSKLPMGAREHRAQAKAFIEAARGEAPMMALAAETQSLREAARLKDEMLADMANRLAAMEEKMNAPKAKAEKAA